MVFNTHFFCPFSFNSSSEILLLFPLKTFDILKISYRPYQFNKEMILNVLIECSTIQTLSPATYKTVGQPFHAYLLDRNCIHGLRCHHSPRNNLLKTL